MAMRKAPARSGGSGGRRQYGATAGGRASQGGAGGGERRSSFGGGGASRGGDSRSSEGREGRSSYGAGAESESRSRGGTGVRDSRSGGAGEGGEGRASYGRTSTSSGEQGGYGAAKDKRPRSDSVRGAGGRGAGGRSTAGGEGRGAGGRSTAGGRRTAGGEGRSRSAGGSEGRFSPGRRAAPVRALGGGRGRSAERPVADATGEVSDEFITGRRAVMEALKSERAINKLLVQDNAEGGGLGELLALARQHSIVIQQVPKAKLDDVATNRSHQGVLAYVAAKPYAELDELIAKAKSGYPGLLVVLDGVEDPHNLGSILRSVDGVGAAGVIIPKRRAVPLTGTVSKSSAGALEHVQVARVANISQTLELLKKEGFWIIGAAGEAAKVYTEADFTGNVVLVIGNEGEGLSRLVSEHCDFLVKLPMHGQINSLNAGVAAGILLYEVVRQRAVVKA